MRREDLLLVIDMQNVYTQGQKWECLNTNAVAGRIGSILEDERCPDVIFTRYLPAQEPQGTWKDYNEVNRDVNSDRYANEMMPQFEDALKKYPLYTKSVYSSLAIAQVLEAARKARRVIITGVVAECCVLSTVMALIDEGIYTVYLTDGVAGLTRQKEAAAELVLSGLEPLHIALMTVEDYLREKE